MDEGLQQIARRFPTNCGRSISCTIRGLKAWFDKSELAPGSVASSKLSSALRQCRATVIFIGSYGMGDWQSLEVGAALAEFARRHAPVIPVMIGGITARELPDLLTGLSAVDGARIDSALDQIAFGIFGERRNGNVI